MATDVFLKLEGVKGESIDPRHKEEINVITFQFGARNPSSISSGTTGSGTGRVSISSFKVRKRSDRSSPILFQACCAGQHFSRAVVTLRKAGGHPLEYLIFEMTRVYVDEIFWEGPPVEDLRAEECLETVGFSFGSIQVKYTPQKADGSGDSPIYGGWDLTTNLPR